MVSCINAFVGFHILYSFPHNPQYQRSLFPFTPLLPTLSHFQIERRTSLLWWSSSWVRIGIIFRFSLLHLIAPGTQEGDSVCRRKPGRKSWPLDTQQQSIPYWYISLTSDVGTTVVLSGKHNQNRKQRWSHQYDTGCNTTILLTLINQ